MKYAQLFTYTFMTYSITNLVQHPYDYTNYPNTFPHIQFVLLYR